MAAIFDVHIYSWRPVGDLQRIITANFGLILLCDFKGEYFKMIFSRNIPNLLKCKNKMAKLQNLTGREFVSQGLL